MANISLKSNSLCICKWNCLSWTLESYWMVPLSWLAKKCGRWVVVVTVTASQKAADSSWPPCTSVSSLSPCARAMEGHSSQPLHLTAWWRLALTYQAVADVLGEASLPACHPCSLTIWLILTNLTFTFCVRQDMMLYEMLFYDGSCWLSHELKDFQNLSAWGRITTVPFLFIYKYLQFS